MTKLPRLAALILLLLAVSSAACAARPEAAAVPTRPASAPTTAPDASPAAPATSTPLPVLPTLAPSTTAGPAIVQPVPQPLDSSGPWLAFPCGAETNLPQVTNADGSGCAAFTLPGPIPADRAWQAFPAQRGGFAAFRLRPLDEAKGSAAYNLRPQSLDDQIWIVHLPENRIVRVITQIDAAGWETIRQQQSQAGANKVPLPLALVLDPASYRWSPDGRYLAYTNVSTDGANISLYDAEKDVIRPLTYEMPGVIAWQWSPSSRWLLFREITGCALAERCQLEPGPKYYAGSTSGVYRQFQAISNNLVVDWYQKDVFLLRALPEGSTISQGLQRIDPATGEVRQLTNRPLDGYIYIPQEDILLVNLQEKQSGDNIPGLHYFFPQDGSLKPFELAKYTGYQVEWEHSLGRFVLSKSIGDGLWQVTLTDHQLLQPVNLGKLRSTTLVSSPDGAWFTAVLETGETALFSSQGEMIRALSKAAQGEQKAVTWLSDSSAFYFRKADCRASAGCIERYEQGKNWAAAPVGDLSGPEDNFSIMEP